MFFFTDNKDLIEKGKLLHWDVKELLFDKSINVKNARWHKVNAHILFPDYDYSLWLDGNISIENKTPFALFDNLIARGVKVSIPIHPSRSCVYAEAKIIKKWQIEYPKVVDSEMKFLRKEKYPKNNGLSETNIMLRKHNDAQIVKVQGLWWSMIEKYSKRDQLSCNYAFWKNSVAVNALYPDAGYHRNCEEFKLSYPTTHNQNKVNEKYILKIFRKTKSSDGCRKFYLFGLKIFSYTKK